MKSMLSTYFSLYLGVWERRHNCPWLHIGSASRYIPTHVRYSVWQLNFFGRNICSVSIASVSIAHSLSVWYWPGGHANPEFEPSNDGLSVPESERCSSLHRLLQQLVLLLLPPVEVTLASEATNSGHAVRLHHLSLSKVRLGREGSGDKATTSRLQPLVFLTKYPASNKMLSFLPTLRVKLKDIIR